MISQCFSCGENFKYWGSGKIYALSRDNGRNVERFWLCSKCSEQFRVHVNAEGAVELAPLQQKAA